VHELPLRVDHSQEVEDQAGVAFNGTAFNGFLETTPPYLATIVYVSE
jgi:hypothetical protein